MKVAALTALFFAALAYGVPVDSLTPATIASKAASGLRLLQLGADKTPEWYTEAAKLNLLRQDVRFVDVTGTWTDKQTLLAQSKPQRAAAAFPAPSHQAAVNPLLPNISITRMNTTLATLTALNTRYYTSTTGATASTMIRDAVQKIITDNSRSDDISVALYKHTWVQSSIIAKIKGSVDNAAPMIIIGAHMDSINLNSPKSGRAPGADDDGSGLVNLIEILQVLVESGWKPATPVEFHWYSGEEAGLLGSDAIATAYSKAGAKIKAMMQLDMTAYFKPGTKEVIALEADYIDASLNAFTRQLIAAYSTLPAADDTPCGYACSDHASWYQFNYPTVMPFEAITGNDNQKIHSPNDLITQAGFSWSHSVQFVRVALGYVYELSAATGTSTSTTPTTTSPKPTSTTTKPPTTTSTPPSTTSVPPTTTTQPPSETCSFGKVIETVTVTATKAWWQF